MPTPRSPHSLARASRTLLRAGLTALIVCLLAPAADLPAGGSDLSAQQPMRMQQRGAPMLLPGGALAVWDDVDGAIEVVRLARMQMAGDDADDTSIPDLREGDRLVSVQGERAADARALFAAYRGVPAGETVTLVVDRGGDEVRVEFDSPGATMVMAPPSGDSGPSVVSADEGAAASGWTTEEEPAETVEADAPSALAGYELAMTSRGVEVVLELMHPANAGVPLRPGDRILRVDGESVGSPEALTERWAALAPGGSLTLSVERDGEVREVTVRRPGG